MEVVYESGKASGGREESVLLSGSYELQANERHEARFTCSFGPITYRNPRKFSIFEWAFAVVAILSIAATLVFNLSVVIASATHPRKFVNLTDGLNSSYNFCSTVEQSELAFTCQTDLILGIVIAVNACFVLYYVWDGLFREQKFEILAFVLATIFICPYVIIDYIFELSINSSTSTSKSWALARLSITLTLAPFNIILAFVVFWKMKYLLYFMLGANPVLFKIYRRTRILSTLVKLNFEVFVSLFLLVVTRVPLFSTTPLHAPLAPHPAEVAIVCVLLLAAILGVALSTIGMYKERPHLSRAYLGIQFFIALYCTIRIVWTSNSWSWHKKTVDLKGNVDVTAVIAVIIISLSAIGIILTLAIFPVYIIVMRNYGKGLKDKCTAGSILTVVIFPIYIIVMKNYGQGLKDKLFG